MTDKKLTEIVLIVDRSGSMGSIRSDAEGGVNTFINEQKKAPGRADLTLVEFDNRYTIKYDGVDIQEVAEYELIPRGGTALLDAIGKTIGIVGERLSKEKEGKRPGSVIVVIVTDGHENASVEYTKTQINELITQQTDEWKWEFVYLAAGQDAIAEGRNLGINTASNYQANSRGFDAVYKGMSGRITRSRASFGSQSLSSAGPLPTNMEDDELIKSDSKVASEDSTSS